MGCLPEFPTIWLIDGVDVGFNGDIYLTGVEANVINKIELNLLTLGIFNHQGLVLHY